jgi:hypothetical protein
MDGAISSAAGVFKPKECLVISPRLVDDLFKQNLVAALKVESETKRELDNY